MQVVNANRACNICLSLAGLLNDGNDSRAWAWLSWFSFGTSEMLIPPQPHFICDAVPVLGHIAFHLGIDLKILMNYILRTEKNYFI